MVTALAANHGVGYDFSGTGAVLRGRYDRPPGTPPFACVCSPDVRSEHGPELGRYERTVTVDVFAWVQCSSEDLDARCLVAEALQDKLMGALEVARNTAGNALRNPRGFLVRGAAFPGDADALGAQVVACAFEVVLQYKRTTGLSS